MAIGNLTADKLTAKVGDKITFTATISGLTPGTTTTAAGHMDATLNDGTTIAADSPAITVTTPGQTVASLTVTFQGSELVPNSDGTYTAIVK